MKYSDMHMHGNHSDGKGWPFEFALEAATKDIDTLGFSDHSPIPFNNEWSMKLNSMGKYVDSILTLKNEFRGRINIYLGMELDYIPDTDVKKHIGFKHLPLDYFIGSVHYIYSKKLDRFLEVDSSADDFKYLVTEGFDGDGRKVYESYYSNVRDMIKEYRPVFTAHVDLVTKNNGKNLYFDVNESAYLYEVDKTLDVAKTYGTIIEVNMGGMAKGYMNSPYPSVYILRECQKRGIPITMNSDAHRPSDMAYHFDSVMRNLKKIGFREIMQYKKGRWTGVLL